jgi:viologen exporter family transport system permease protein
VVSVYRALLVAELQAAAQYRVQSVLWLLLTIVRPIVFLAAWTAAAATQGGSIGSFDAADFAAYYVALTLVGQLTNAWEAYDFEYEVRNGQLSPKLLRPLHPVHYLLVANIVWKLATLPALLPVLVLIAWTFHARFETQPWQIALFVPSVLLAAALRFLVSLILGTTAFWTTRIHALMSFYDRLTFLFAGQIAPLSLLPGPLQVLAYILPFGYMLGVPADLLRGGPSLSTALTLMAGQAIWLMAAWFGFVLIWRAGLRQYSAVGA